MLVRKSAPEAPAVRWPTLQEGGEVPIMMTRIRMRGRQQLRCSRIIGWEGEREGERT